MTKIHSLSQLIEFENSCFCKVLFVCLNLNDITELQLNEPIDYEKKILIQLKK